MFTVLYLSFVLAALYQPVISFPLTASQRKMTVNIFRRSNIFQGTARMKLSHSNRGAGPRTIVQMKDASCAYWFNVGDKVKASSSVVKAGIELKGRVGVVMMNTWEKCDVDPTCCCAEFVDDNFAVRASLILAVILPVTPVQMNLSRALIILRIILMNKSSSN